MSIFNNDEDILNPSLADQIVELIPEGENYATILETLSGVLASFIIHAGLNDRQRSMYLKTVQSDIASKVFGGIH